MGKNVLVLGLTLLVLFGGVASASTSSSASEWAIFYLRSSLYVSSSACLLFDLSFLFNFFLEAEIISGFFSNAVSVFMKWLWSLKATTKTGIDLWKWQHFLAFCSGFCF